MKITKIREHSFIAEIICPKGYLIDCGAHRGEFSRAMSEDFDLKVVGIEANPTLFRNLPELRNVEFIHAAVSSCKGKIKFSKPEGQDGSIVYYDEDEADVIEVEAINLNEYICGLDISCGLELLKLDIEGAELQVLESLSDSTLQKIKQITVEFHDFLDQSDLPAIKQTISRMQSLGFYSFKVSHFTYGDVLFVNSNIVAISTFASMKIQVFDIWFKGFIRLLKRKSKFP